MAQDVPAVPTAQPRPRRRAMRKPGQTLAPLLFISVAVVLFVLFFLGPGSLGLYYSFTE